jgi:hypothetical protein
MKKIIILAGLFMQMGLQAQNLQLHYDFGTDRKYFTATHEMYKSDKLGSTFWFIDFDFNYPVKSHSMSAAYWEISRTFFIPGLKKLAPFKRLAVHFEYNDGFAAFETTPGDLIAISYNSVFLTGLEFPVSIGDFMVSTQLLARLPLTYKSPGFQFTLVWSQLLFKKILLAGYMDLWSQKRVNTETDELVFQTEPQLWFLVTKKIALGGEVEISKNFPAGPQDWQASPTLGIRWEF